MPKLKIGDVVSWRHGWGREEPKKATIETIQLNEENNSKFGKLVDSVDWRLAEDRNIIVCFSDQSSWAWGFQIRPLGEKHD